jgi:hypothetical protein
MSFGGMLERDQQYWSRFLTFHAGAGARAHLFYWSLSNATRR